KYQVVRKRILIQNAHTGADEDDQETGCQAKSYEQRFGMSGPQHPNREQQEECCNVAHVVTAKCFRRATAKASSRSPCRRSGASYAMARRGTTWQQEKVLFQSTYDTG